MNFAEVALFPNLIECHRLMVIFLQATRPRELRPFFWCHGVGRSVLIGEGHCAAALDREGIGIELETLNGHSIAGGSKLR